ncbi:hypothetical protein [Aureimonas sp. AU12]|uniref:hypothetical protein n=1 Tax=Aureimonas sp. AU12 TaxID=1638161 RepID=UPI0007846E17|nr:hypothetical protein [Aureimonas sp. AU12]
MASQVAREGFEGAAVGVASLRPKRFDRQGFFGRDADGGIERYRDYSDYLSSDQILAALYAWERDRGVFLVVCVGLLSGVPLSALYGVLTIPFALGLITGALFMAVKAAVADFRAWQIQQGRFGAPVEYLNHRLPRNMQIMEKDHP